MPDTFKDIRNDFFAIEKMINKLEFKKSTAYLSNDELTDEEELKLKELYEYEKQLVFMMAKAKGVLDFSPN